MRYDADWRQYSPPRPYDRGFRDRGFSGEWERSGTPGPERTYPPDYDGDYQEPANRGIYGPARYGLGPYHERLRRRRRSDDDVQEDVEEALFYDTWVDADAITVEVEEGIVVLTGELPSYDEVRFATDDAWDVEGVLGVRSELRVSDR
ncbi:MAG: BON domain-containing protein [Gemmatimonadota bacterium]